MVLMAEQVKDPSFFGEIIPQEMESMMSTLAINLSSAQRAIVDILSLVEDVTEVVPSGGPSVGRAIDEAVEKDTGSIADHRSLAMSSVAAENETGYGGSRPHTIPTSHYLRRADGSSKYSGATFMPYGENGEIYMPHGPSHERNGKTWSLLEGGAQRRRLNPGNNNGNEDQCTDVNFEEHKIKQCERLYDCAQNYNYYDLFIFMFGDDIDFDTGKMDDNISILGKASSIIEKFNNIQLLLQDNIIDISDGGRCDQVLQEFFRFDEEIGTVGKWQGGSVTSVCRGWGTTKFLTFESIFQTIKSADPNLEYETLENFFVADLGFINGETYVKKSAEAKAASAEDLPQADLDMLRDNIIAELDVGAPVAEISFVLDVFEQLFSCVVS